MEKGTVVEHKKSGKRYAVVTNRDGWIGYIGIRGSKNFGAIRSSNDVMFARNFTEVAYLRAIFRGSYSWNFTVENIEEAK